MSQLHACRNPNAEIPAGQSLYPYQHPLICCLHCSWEELVTRYPPSSAAVQTFTTSSDYVSARLTWPRLLLRHMWRVHTCAIVPVGPWAGGGWAHGWAGQGGLWRPGGASGLGPPPESLPAPGLTSYAVVVTSYAPSPCTAQAIANLISNKQFWPRDNDFPPLEEEPYFGVPRM